MKTAFTRRELYVLKILMIQVAISLGFPRIKVVLSDDGSMGSELAFTSSKGVIYINIVHPLVTKRPKDKQVAFIIGLFMHELLHHYYTDFKKFETELPKYPAKQQQIFSLCTNILEDPAIENFAKTIVGGRFLAALRYVIAECYYESPNIDEAETAFSQWVSAMIHFGDLGLVKGNFTFPEAKEAFNNTVTLFYNGINEPDGSKRIDIAKELMEMTRPLWESDIEKQTENAAEQMKRHGKSGMNGSGSGHVADNGNSDEAPTSTEKRRRITIEKISKEEYEKMKEEGTSAGNGELPDGDITLYVCDEATDDNSGNGGGTQLSLDELMNNQPNESSEKSSGKKQSATSNGNTTDENGDDDNDGDNEASKENGASKDGMKSKSESEAQGDKDNNANTNDSQESNDSGSNDNPFVTPMGAPNQKIADKEMPEGFEAEGENVVIEIDSEEYEISNEDIERLLEEMKRIDERIPTVDEENDKANPLDDADVTSPVLGSRSCLNYRVTFSEFDREELEDSYEEVVENMYGGIRTLSRKLKRLFLNDQEEIEHGQSGRVNLKRLYSPTLTLNVFDKRIAPSEKSNCCVEILVDESGSMGSGGKAISARKCCIALAEVFHQLDIPLYIIGFTADTKGYDVVHNHYITWKNSANERLKLLNVSARANNCDGYSIRYATEILKKKRAMHKLLIVISDGQPAAHNYYQGVQDTMDAIKSARSHTAILGVAVGNNDTETIQKMYGNDFMHISCVEDLFEGIAGKVHTIVKKW